MFQYYYNNYVNKPAEYSAMNRNAMGVNLPGQNDTMTNQQFNPGTQPNQGMTENVSTSQVYGQYGYNYPLQQQNQALGQTSQPNWVPQARVPVHRMSRSRIFSWYERHMA